MRQFFTTANIPVFGANLKGIINEWNEVTEKITGFKKKEVLGSHWLEYTPINYEEEIKKVVRKALIGKETTNYEFSSVSKDGRNIVLLVNINTRRNSNGEIIGVLVLGQDITELDSYRNTLEVKVYERTLKLNEALKKQKEQNEIQSKFVLTASHEFRTPLSAINFAAGSIKKYWTKMDPKKIEKKLHRIENQVVHMTELLDDILMVVQGEAGEIINSPLLLNLGVFISEIIDEVYYSFKRSHKIVLIDPQELKNS
jgi:PAS domain S-box-containing protein